MLPTHDTHYCYSEAFTVFLLPFIGTGFCQWISLLVETDCGRRHKQGSQSRGKVLVHMCSWSLSLLSDEHKDFQSCFCAVACKNRQLSASLICKPIAMHRSACLLKFEDKEVWPAQRKKKSNYLIFFYLFYSVWEQGNDSPSIATVCVNWPPAFAV